MKILKTIGILAIVAGLMIGGTGSVYAKGPPEGLPAGGPDSPGKHGLFGTVESTDGYDVILVTKDGTTVGVTLPPTAKYKVPRETKGPVDLEGFEDILGGDITAIVGKRVAVLVKELAENDDPPPDFTATAIRLMLIPTGPPLHAHRVGIVQEGFIPGESDSITIIDNHGEPHTFGINYDSNGETVYRPDGTEAANIVPGSVVTVVTTGDPKNAANDVAKAIVLHEDLPEWALGMMGKIIVEKQTTDEATGTFEFNSAAFDPVSFSLSDDDQNTSDWLLPGIYDVTETVPTGWELTNILPDDDNSTVDLPTATATIHLEAGETVTVVFTDTYMVAPAP